MSKEKVRVYILARELNVESKDLLEMCKQAGFDVKNQLSSLEPEQRDALEQMVKRGPQAAKPAEPAKPVTRVLAPEARAVPTLPTRTRREAEPARPAVVEDAPPAPPAVPVAEPAPAPAAQAPVEPTPPPVPTPQPPAVPALRDRGMPSLPSGPRDRGVPTLSGSPPRAPAPTAPPTAPSATPPAAAPAAKAPVPPATPQQPPAARPPQAPTPPRVPSAPTMPSPVAKSPPDLGNRPGGPGRPGAPGAPGRPAPARPGSGTPPRRTMGRPGMAHLGPVAPPSLKPFRTQAPPKSDGTLKPIAKLTKEHLERTDNRPLRPEDLLRPQQPQAEVVAPADESEDEKNKGKNLKAVPGRDKRKEDRNKRAETRKVSKAEKVEIRAGGRIAELRDKEESRTAGLRHKLKQRQKQQTAPRKGKVELETPITIRALSEALGIKAGELLFKLRGHGAPASITINSTLETEMAELMATEYGIEVDIKQPLDAEDQLIKDLTETADKEEDMVARAPIVTIMGHVDHGKTTLLDKIRQSNVAATEAGGITQVIRAWRVEHEGKPITFLDTPGHEAFTKMRARGAQVTDIAVIVVAADDGVMPQTEEAISHAKAAGVSLVIAINKIDMPQANVERTRRQLYGLNVLPDNMGGDTPFVETSAATGLGIDDLLEAISVVAELKELRANPNKPARGTCLEASLSEGEGVRATLLIQDGTLRRGEVVLCGATYGRIRQLYNDLGQPIQEAGPSVPVRITGLDEVPNADDPFNILPDATVAREIAEKRKGKLQEANVTKRAPLSLERLAETKVIELKVILKADFRGSVEAIRKELEKLDHEEVRVRVLHTGIGAITESDVQLALTSPEDTLIVGFNVVPDDRALTLAEEKGVRIREYDIIYNLTNDIRAALEGKLKPREEVIHLGRAMVRETFKVSRVGTIAGCYVTQGTIKRNAKVRVIREGVVVYPPTDRSASLESLKRFKDDVGEVREGFECGMKVAGYDDVKVGDVIEAYRVEQVQRTLEMAAAGK